MPSQPAKPIDSRRHTGRDCRYPGHMDVKVLRHPWLLDSGNPCRNDESLNCSQNRPKSLHRRTLMSIRPAKAFKLTRHPGRECRDPGHRDVKDLCHPWLLDSGNPLVPQRVCRNDESLNCSHNRPKSLHLRTLMPIRPAKAFKLTRHPGRDSRQAILPDALRVNANLFLTDLCRYSGHRDVKALCHPWLLDSCRAVLPGPLRASANPLPADLSGNPLVPQRVCRNDESLNCSQNRPKSIHRRTLMSIQGRRSDSRSGIASMTSRVKRVTLRESDLRIELQSLNGNNSCKPTTK
jgi:hypothetical protein